KFLTAATLFRVLNADAGIDRRDGSSGEAGSAATLCHPKTHRGIYDGAARYTDVFYRTGSIHQAGPQLRHCGIDLCLEWRRTGVVSDDSRDRTVVIDQSWLRNIFAGRCLIAS